MLLLHLILLIYSLSGVASKYSSYANPFSAEFVIGYSMVLALLGIYAIGWQQIIKHMSLTMAYANKAVVMIWGLFWGVVLFGEKLTFGKIIGTLFIVSGIVLYSCSSKEKHMNDECLKDN